MLETEALVIKYGPFLALDGVDISVGDGEIVGVIGANGAGKSSLVRAIAGLVPAASGRIVFEGRALDAEPPHQRNRMGIALVPEGRGLFARMSVEENLMMGGYPLPTRHRMADNMQRCFDLFPVLRERRHQLAGTLSGGQQQMLAVGMGLMSEPKLLILDEPSLGLAPIVIGEIGERLKQLKSLGMTILLAEQNATLTGNITDRIYVLQTGRVRYHDKPDVLFKMPEVAESFLSI
ncbi:MAG: ABC transporter ATP-binding protein [Xanthobacteraceae bacterium]|jgi:branched-chain amino acid transport system ATP-binding protein